MASINILALESIDELNEQEVGSVVGGNQDRNNNSRGRNRRRRDTNSRNDNSIDRSDRSNRSRSRRDTFRGMEQIAQNLSVAQGGNAAGSGNTGNNTVNA